jgi:hypothetical protein
MTDNDTNTNSPQADDENIKKELSPEEREREEQLKKRIEALRKRDPFIYR